MLLDQLESTRFIEGLTSMGRVQLLKLIPSRRFYRKGGEELLDMLNRHKRGLPSRLYSEATSLGRWCYLYGRGPG
jgi:hypothetical protein